MNQQINLYQPIFRRQKKVFSSMTMIQISAIFLVVFAVIYVYGELKLQPVKDQLLTLEKNLVLLNGELSKAQRLLPGSSGSKLLENEIARLTNELSNRQQVQSLLTNRIGGNTEGLSSYLEAFARQHVKGTWLTKITIIQGGNNFALEGKTLTSELVPIYIDGLASESILNGMSFNVMELSRPEEPENHFNFLVSTN